MLFNTKLIAERETLSELLSLVRNGRTTERVCRDQT